MKREVNTADLFCGAGGATTGLELALADLGLRGRGIAVNHWKVAIASHQANHPATRHLCAAVESLVPAEVVPGGNLDVLWASPSCTHHSRALGGRPRANQLRAQPDLILSWLDQLFVRRLIVENVPEFVEWGPLAANGKPLASRRGTCFNAWLQAIEARSYRLEWRILNCADYGDATTRRRFFLQAVRIGCGKIEWPDPTHSDVGGEDLFGNRLARWRGFDTCIDWADLGTPISQRKKPLAKNTMDRIREGIRRFGGSPFVIGQQSGSTPRPADEPIPTVSTSGAIAFCQPFVIPMEHSGRNRLRSVSEPIPTVSTARGGAMAIAQPFIVDFLRGRPPLHPSQPIGAMHTKARFGLATPFIVHLNRNCTVRDVSAPIPTETTSGAHFALAVPVSSGAAVVDVLFRMCKPGELAAAHSFPSNYRLEGTKADQTKQIGNSVPVETARAIGRAALREIAANAA